MYKQISLNYWKNDYSSDFFCFFDPYFFDKLLAIDHQFLLCGPPKSGKKHLAFKLANMKHSKILIADDLSDSEIIDSYDSFKRDLSSAIWIKSSTNSVFFSRDVQSRFDSLVHIVISSLSSDHFLTFLKIRLNRIGVILDDSLLNYSISRLPCSYFWIDSFITFIESSSSISVRSLKVFFDSLDIV